MAARGRVKPRQQKEHIHAVVDDKCSLGRRFWIIAIALALLLVCLKSYRINRPYNGLHSWAEASGAWVARCHVNYGLGYTKGIATMEVGNPPGDKPLHYLNHPQLGYLINAAWMAVLGTNTLALRVKNIAMALTMLVLLLKVVRYLRGDTMALLAGLFFVMFPLTGYFGSKWWVFSLALWAFWRYLGLIGELTIKQSSKWRLLVELALCLLLMIQLCWTGVFFAFVIGFHYVLRCIWRKQKPSATLLAVLVAAPLASIAINFLIMYAGHGWDIDKIVGLYKWRASSGERGAHNWSEWISKFWEFSKADYTIPVLLMALGYSVYLVVGRFAVWAFSADRSELPGAGRELWFFLWPAVIFILVFKSLVWEHQYWLWPFAGYVAIAAASVVVLVWRVLAKVTHVALGYVVAGGVVVLCAVYCWQGLMAFHHDHRWQSERTLELFKKLNKEIPPDKALLGFKDFMIQQNKAKLAHYRPEYAWYLDRHVMAARKIEDIRKQAFSGRYIRYFIPDCDQPPYLFYEGRKYLRSLSYDDLLKELKRATSAGQNDKARLLRFEHAERYRMYLISQLKKMYPYEHFSEDPADRCPRGNVPCYLFDLTTPLTPSASQKQ